MNDCPIADYVGNMISDTKFCGEKGMTVHTDLYNIFHLLYVMAVHIWRVFGLMCVYKTLLPSMCIVSNKTSWFILKVYLLRQLLFANISVLFCFALPTTVYNVVEWRNILVLRKIRQYCWKIPKININDRARWKAHCHWYFNCWWGILNFSDTGERNDMGGGGFVYKILIEFDAGCLWNQTN